MPFEPMRLFPLLVLLTSPLWGQGRHPTPSESPRAFVTADPFAFRTFEDDHGGFYVVWNETHPDGVALLGQHIGMNGENLWGETGKSLATELAPQAHWEAAPDAKGGLLLAWERDNAIAARRYGLDGGTSWPSKNERLSISTSTQAYPALVPDGAGGAYVVWQEKRLPNRWVLMVQHLNAMGALLWTTEGIRVSLRPSDQKRPQIVYDGAAGAVIAWNDFRESASQLQAQRLNYQGNRLWGLEGVLITAPSGDPAKLPFIGGVGGGSAVVAWQAPSAGADRIFLELVGPTGRFAWKQPGIELTAGTWHEWNPVLHGDGQGGTWVGWEDYRDNTHWTIYIKHLLVNGKAGWPTNESRVSTVAADQGKIALTDDGQKGVLVAWVDNRNGALGTYLQQIDEQGQPRQGLDGQTLMTGLKNPQAPQVLSLTPTSTVIAWADTPSKGHWTLYWKTISTISDPPK